MQDGQVTEDRSARGVQRRQPYVPSGPLRAGYVGLAAFMSFDLVVQVVGMIFFDFNLVRSGLAAFVGLAFGTAFLGLVVYSRRTDARSVPRRTQ